MATSLTPQERRLRAQVAAHTRWARPGERKRHGRKILEAKLARHERLVDPDGELDPAERRQLAENSLAAEMTRLSLKAAKARRRARSEADVEAS